METIRMRKAYYFSGKGKVEEGTDVEVPPMFAKRFIARGMAVKSPEGAKAQFTVGAQAKTQKVGGKEPQVPMTYMELKADAKAQQEKKKAKAAVAAKKTK